MTTQRHQILIPRIYLIWKKRSLRLSILSLPCIIQVGLNDITNVFVTGNDEFGETHRKALSEDGGTDWRNMVTNTGMIRLATTQEVKNEFFPNS